MHASWRKNPENPDKEYYEYDYQSINESCSSSTASYESNSGKFVHNTTHTPSGINVTPKASPQRKDLCLTRSNNAEQGCRLLLPMIGVGEDWDPNGKISPFTRQTSPTWLKNTDLWPLKYEMILKYCLQYGMTYKYHAVAAWNIHNDARLLAQWLLKSGPTLNYYHRGW